MTIRFSDLLLEQLSSGNREPISPWKVSVVISLAVTAFLAVLNATGCFQILEWALLDQYFQLRASEKVDSRLLLITIDESDISKLQNWPLSDEQLAQLLTSVNRYQPNVIGLDLYRDLSVPPGSSALEEVFNRTPNLIGVEKVGYAPVAPPPTLAELGQVAMSDLLIDEDSTVRRALLSAKIGDEVKRSLGASLALQYLTQLGIDVDATSPSGAAQLGTTTFPRLMPNAGGYVNADTTGYQILLNFRGPDDAFDTISATDVLQGKLSAELVRDRIVIIGSTAASLNTLVNTPYDTSYLTQTPQSPALAIHAHIASQIISAVLDGRPLIRTWPTVVEWGWTVLWCGLSSGIILIPQWYRRNSLSVLLWIGVPTLGLSAALLSISSLLFMYGWWIPSIPTLLGVSIAAIVGVVASNSKLIEDAYIDGLTHLFNRRAFNQYIVEAQKKAQAIAIILCDVDHFKGFNDCYGHPAGDDCLRQVAQAIQQAVRSQDIVARYGGEEFAVILQDISGEKASEIAERMRQKVQNCQIPHQASAASPYVSISCGVAIRAAQSQSPLPQVLVWADRALYQAKRAGRNRVEIYVPPTRTESVPESTPASPTASTPELTPGLTTASTPAPTVNDAASGSDGQSADDAPDRPASVADGQEGALPEGDASDGINDGSADEKL